MSDETTTIDITVDISDLLAEVNGDVTSAVFAYQLPGASWVTGVEDTDYEFDIDEEDPLKGELTWTADFSSLSAGGIANARIAVNGLTYGFNLQLVYADSAATPVLPGGVFKAKRMPKETIREKLDTIIEQLEEVITNTTPADTSAAASDDT